MTRWSRPLAMLLVASALRGQSGSPQLSLSVPGELKARSDVPTVSLSNVLTEGHNREMLAAGWPTVLHCRVDLWKKGFIAFSIEATVEWDYVVEYSPLTGLYQVRRQRGGRIDTLGTVKTITDAEQIVDRPVKPAISPQSSGGHYYYDFSLAVSALSMSDLDAWQKWVRGDAGPAVKGKRSVWSALKGGAGVLLSRVLGGNTQTYGRRSDIFTAG